MIKKLKLDNFTVFDSLEYSPVRGLNVILGYNGTGKTHLLKILYSIVRSFSISDEVDRSSKQRFSEHFTRRVLNNFLIDKIGRLSSRTQGHKRTSLNFQLVEKKGVFEAGWSTRNQFADISSFPKGFYPINQAIYIPSREILTLYNGFLEGVYEKQIRVEEHYADLAAQLGRGGKGNFSVATKEYLKQLESIFSAKVVYKEKEKQFYIRQAGQGNIEIGLAAEGHKKLGTLAHLISNRNITGNEIIFIDEPEANMNPGASRTFAHLLYAMATDGNQVFVATHDYYLLKYLDILKSEYTNCPIEYLNFYKESTKDHFVQYETAKSVNELNYNRVFMEFEEIHKKVMGDFFGE